MAVARWRDTIAEHALDLLPVEHEPFREGLGAQPSRFRADAFRDHPGFFARWMAASDAAIRFANSISRTKHDGMTTALARSEAVRLANVTRDAMPGDPARF